VYIELRPASCEKVLVPMEPATARAGESSSKFLGLYLLGVKCPTFVFGLTLPR